MGTSLKDTIANFQTKIAENETKSNKNPFSDTWVKPTMKTTDPGYGRPPEGSKTEKRGIRAGKENKI